MDPTIIASLIAFLQPFAGFIFNEILPALTLMWYLFVEVFYELFFLELVGWLPFFGGGVHPRVHRTPGNMRISPSELIQQGDGSSSDSSNGGSSDNFHHDSDDSNAAQPPSEHDSRSLGGTRSLEGSTPTLGSHSSLQLRSSPSLVRRSSMSVPRGGLGALQDESNEMRHSYNLRPRNRSMNVSAPGDVNYYRGQATSPRGSQVRMRSRASYILPSPSLRQLRQEQGENFQVAEPFLEFEQDDDQERN